MRAVSSAAAAAAATTTSGDAQSRVSSACRIIEGF